MSDKYDQLAEEAVLWFAGWIRPLGMDANPDEIKSVCADIARVFRDGLKVGE